jgi:hypothetical protein
MSLPSSRAVAHVATPLARRYMGQLCMHFRHRLPVTLAEEHALILFPAGRCGLEARPDALSIRLEAETPALLPSLQDVVVRHLRRFAFRDPPTIDWQPEANTA